MEGFLGKEEMGWAEVGTVKTEVAMAAEPPSFSTIVWWNNTLGDFRAANHRRSIVSIGRRWSVQKHKDSECSLPVRSLGEVESIEVCASASDRV
jgi:hypothetical protein